MSNNQSASEYAERQRMTWSAVLGISEHEQKTSMHRAPLSMRRPPYQCHAWTWRGRGELGARTKTRVAVKGQLSTSFNVTPRPVHTSTSCSLLSSSSPYGLHGLQCHIIGWRVKKLQWRHFTTDEPIIQLKRHESSWPSTYDGFFLNLRPNSLDYNIVWALNSRCFNAVSIVFCGCFYGLINCSSFILIHSGWRSGRMSWLQDDTGLGHRDGFCHLVIVMNGRPLETKGKWAASLTAWRWRQHKHGLFGRPARHLCVQQRQHRHTRRGGQNGLGQMTRILNRKKHNPVQIIQRQQFRW
jgi:hypothetical protein